MEYADSGDYTYLPPQDASGTGVWLAMPTAPQVEPPALQEQIAVMQENIAWLEKENERQNDELAALRAKTGTIGRRLATVLRHLGMEK